MIFRHALSIRRNLRLYVCARVCVVTLETINKHIMLQPTIFPFWSRDTIFCAFTRTKPDCNEFLCSSILSSFPSVSISISSSALKCAQTVSSCTKNSFISACTPTPHMFSPEKKVSLMCRHTQPQTAHFCVMYVINCMSAAIRRKEMLHGLHTVSIKAIVTLTGFSILYSSASGFFPHA